MHPSRILNGSLAVLLLAARASAQDVTFARDDYASYAGARAIVAGDFDRNGWPDLAQANTGRNTVTILLNDGGGRMRRAFDVAVGAGPFALASGDFTRDGILDLAVANADGNSISLLNGRDDGTFVRTDIGTSPYLGPRGITATDVNGDGLLDLVYTGYGSNVAQILTGQSGGRFSKGAAFFVGDLEREIEADARDRLNALLTEADRRGGATTVVRLGAHPAPSIVGYAAEIQADVIVMGTHGRGGTAVGGLGSVAEQVIRTASCPVLTLRQHPSETGLARIAALDTASRLNQGSTSA